MARRVPRWKGVSWSVGAGLAWSVLMAAAFPPWNVWVLAVVSLVPLAWAGACVPLRPMGVAAGVLAGALGFWVYELSWIYEVTDLGFVPMCVMFALYPSAFAWMVWRLWRWTAVPMTLAVPVGWVGLEFLRGSVMFGGYAIGLVGHPLIESPDLASPAGWGGAYFVSLLAAIPAGALLDGMRKTRRGRAWAVGGLAVMVLCFGAGAWQAGAARGGEERRVRLGVVQTNVPESNKIRWSLAGQVRDWERMTELMEQAATGTPDVIVIPETMMPGPTLEPSALAELSSHQIVLRGEGEESRLAIPATAFAQELFRIQGAMSIPMLVGEEGVEGLWVKEGRDGEVEIGRKARYNSVYLVDGGAVKGARYDKMRLTPFGEYMPYIDAWPWLRDRIKAIAARGMSLDLAAGGARTVFVIATEGGEARVVTPICFETTIGSLCRELVFEGGTRRADVVVNVTNDGWFGDSDRAREQHVQAARWRCVELNTPMVRVANTGISCVIDARGRVVKGGVEGSERSSRVDGVMRAEVAFDPRAPGTLYARVGDVVGWLSLGGAGVLVLMAGLAHGGARRAA